MRTDAARVQQLVEAMPQWRVDAGRMSGREMRAMLVHIGIAGASSICEKEALRRQMLTTLRSTSCPICQMEHEDGDRLVVLSCGHTFHHRCIHTAAQESFELERSKATTWPRPRCPCCRKEISLPSGRLRGAKRRREDAPPPILQRNRDSFFG